MFGAQKRLYNDPRKRHLVEDYLNWGRLPADVLRFTRKYAPVIGRRDFPGNRFCSGPFAFDVERWTAIQDRMRGNWTIGSSDFPLANVDVALEDGKSVVYVPILLEFLLLDLFSIPWQRRRRCRNPDCQNPYFVAHHLRQNYCSSVCAKVGQRAWKRNWWKERGAAWRANRKGNAKRQRQEAKGTKKGRSHGKSR
jgi:hypothetical protein